MLSAMTTMKAEAHEAFISRAVRDIDEVGTAVAIRACIELLQEGNEVSECIKSDF